MVSAVGFIPLASRNLRNVESMKRTGDCVSVTVLCVFSLQIKLSMRPRDQKNILSSWMWRIEKKLEIIHDVTGQW